jgi:hypothetical protein
LGGSWPWKQADKSSLSERREVKSKRPFASAKQPLAGQLQLVLFVVGDLGS